MCAGWLAAWLWFERGYVNSLFSVVKGMNKFIENKIGTICVAQAADESLILSIWTVVILKIGIFSRDFRNRLFVLQGHIIEWSLLK